MKAWQRALQEAVPALKITNEAEMPLGLKASIPEA